MGSHLSAFKSNCQHASTSSLCVLLERFKASANKYTHRVCGFFYTDNGSRMFLLSVNIDVS